MKFIIPSNHHLIIPSSHHPIRPTAPASHTAVSPPVASPWPLRPWGTARCDRGAVSASTSGRPAAPGRSHGPPPSAPKCLWPSGPAANHCSEPLQRTRWIRKVFQSFQVFQDFAGGKCGTDSRQRLRNCFQPVKLSSFNLRIQHFPVGVSQNRGTQNHHGVPSGVPHAILVRYPQPCLRAEPLVLQRQNPRDLLGCFFPTPLQGRILGRVSTEMVMKSMSIQQNSSFKLILNPRHDSKRVKSASIKLFCVSDVF